MLLLLASLLPDICCMPPGCAGLCQFHRLCRFEQICLQLLPLGFQSGYLRESPSCSSTEDVGGLNSKER